MQFFSTRHPFARFLALAAILFLVSGCGLSGDKVSSDGAGSPASTGSTLRDPNKGLLDEWFGRGGNARVTGIGVNAYLWRASLDTVSFLPISEADPYGGVILTDWHQLEGTPNERYKVNVYILDSALRSDGLRVAVFWQKRGRDGGWSNVEVSRKTVRNLENAILTRARQLRVGSVR